MNRIEYMKPWNSVRMCLTVMAAYLVLLAPRAQATLAFDFPQLNGNQNAISPRSLGEVFTVNSSITVDALAAYDNPANGSGVFGGNVQVAIYHVTLSGNTIQSGTLVVNPLTFSTADPGTIITGPGGSTVTREHALSSPVQLAAGTYMIVANHYGGSAGTENNWNLANAGVNPPIVPTANTGNGALSWGANYLAVGNLTWNSALPSGFNPADLSSHPQFMAGNFDFTPVPEVAAFGGAAVGLLGLVYVGRHAVLRQKRNLA